MQTINNAKRLSPLRTRVRPRPWTAAVLIGLLALLSSGCDEPMGPGDLDMNEVAVSAAQRLKDYRELSRYPDHARPAGSDTTELEDWPGMDKAQVKSARFLGWDGEEFRAGSPVVYFQLEVKEAGRYSFTTVLEDAKSGEKLVVSQLTRDLAAGKARIGLEFYGLILREKKAGGPFRLKGLLGERLLNDADIEKLTTGRLTESPEGILPMLTAEYTTGSFPLANYTDREYDSPEKQRRIKELEQEVREEARAGGQ